MGKVQVLMSTYNGEQFLREQMESLLNQTYPDLEILVRDDGSQDSTVSILQEYAEKHDCIRIFLERNIGVTNSFFTLLSKSDADYVAFCDQDDVWMEEKVEKAVGKLCTIAGPALYCSNKILVDSELNVIKENGRQRLRPSFGNAVIESICTGCTAVLNRELVLEIKKHLPKNAVIHDWWCYLVACYAGEVVFDEESYICYRQHGNNEIGASKSFWGMLKAKAAYLKKSRGRLKKQLTEFQEMYHSDRQKDELVERLLNSESLKGKLQAVFCSSYYRQSKLDGLITRVLILFGRLL